jgi:acetolactate synthase-1/2/3 large subunit
MRIIKVSDYLVSSLKKCGIDTYFGVQGGAIAHVIESSAKYCDYFPVLNEQAAGLYAHGYYYNHKKAAAVLTTTGPGFLNSITGMGACYYDNVPSVFITGQVSKNLNLAKKFGIKMYGFQEVQHIDIGKNISDNYFKIDSNISLSKFINFLEKNNLTINKTIFIEIQDEFSRSFVKLKNLKKNKIKNQKIKKSQIQKFYKEILSSKKPLILAGNGFSDIKTGKLLINKFSKKMKIPIAFSWGGSTLMDNKNEFNKGYFGLHSPGVANLMIQDSDLLICFGVSLLQHQAGKKKIFFSPSAKILYVNSDLNNNKRIKYDFNNRVKNFNFDTVNFLENINNFKTQKKLNNLNVVENKKSYNFKNRSKPVEIIKNVLEKFNKKNKENIVFSDAGATLSWSYQAANALKQQNLITSFNIHTMGYSICAGIGAAIKSNTKVLSIIGDGSVLMNSQELINYCRVKKNLKILVFDNKGYGIIRQTQDDFFKSNYIGTKIGLKNNIPPYNVSEIIKSFGLKSKTLNENLSNSDISNFINSELDCLIININIKHKVEHISTKNKKQYLPF